MTWVKGELAGKTKVREPIHAPGTQRGRGSPRGKQKKRKTRVLALNRELLEKRGKRPQFLKFKGWAVEDQRRVVEKQELQN